MKVAGVVVLFKPDDKVLKNIKTYINSLEKLYVVDNTPEPNDNASKFKEKKMIYISNHGNQGIANAQNVAAKQAIKDKCTWLLTMDQDSSFGKNGVEDMIEFLEKMETDKSLEKFVGTSFEKIGLISPLHITVRNRLTKQTGIEKPLEVMSSGNLINLKAYKKIGGFKDWMFIDCVDFDYCLNLRNHGYEIVQLNYVRLNHELGNTEEKKILGKTLYVDNHSSMRKYYIVRNRHYLYDMYHNDFPEYCNYELKCTKKELLKIWLYEKNKIKKTKHMLKGYLDYKHGIKGPLK